MFFIKYLKEKEVSNMIGEGELSLIKFNEGYGKLLDLNCRLNYNLGIGMKLMFGLPIIYFEINAFSNLDNLS